MEWTSAVKDDDPWQEIRTNFRSSMDYSPRGESVLSRYEADWGHGIKLGKIYRRTDCAPPATLDFAVRDWADHFKAGGSLTKPVDLSGAMQVDTSETPRDIFAPAPAPPPPPPPPPPPATPPKDAFEAAVARSAKRPAAEDQSLAIVRHGLIHAATPPPRGRSLYSAARSGLRRVGERLDAAATAALPVAEAFNTHVDRELAADALHVPVRAPRGLTTAPPTPAYADLQSFVADLPNGYTWAKIRAALAGTGIDQSEAWKHYKTLGKTD